jgi:hypothetical protein
LLSFNLVENQNKLYNTLKSVINGSHAKSKVPIKVEHIEFEEYEFHENSLFVDCSNVKLEEVKQETVIEIVQPEESREEESVSEDEDDLMNLHSRVLQQTKGKL